MCPHRRTVIKTATLAISGFSAGCLQSPTQRSPATAPMTDTPIPTEEPTPTETSTLKPKPTPRSPESSTATLFSPT